MSNQNNVETYRKRERKAALDDALSEELYRKLRSVSGFVHFQYVVEGADAEREEVVRAIAELHSTGLVEKKYEHEDGELQPYYTGVDID